MNLKLKIFWLMREKIYSDFIFLMEIKLRNFVLLKILFLDMFRLSSSTKWRTYSCRIPLKRKFCHLSNGMRNIFSVNIVDMEAKYFSELFFVVYDRILGFGFGFGRIQWIRWDSVFDRIQQRFGRIRILTLSSKLWIFLYIYRHFLFKFFSYLNISFLTIFS